jgi:tetratricopeptide (TPR) repeat protein
VTNVWRHAAVAASVAAALLLVAFSGGAYDLISRHVLAIAVWWTLLLAVAFGFWPTERAPRAAIVGGLLFLSFALFTAMSATWGPSAERALVEFNRVVLYLGVFLLGALAGSRARAAAWTDGLAVGLVAMAAASLTTRFFHGILDDQGGLPEHLPTAAARLSYPVGYWNGLAILVALGTPLLLRVATSVSSPVVRGAAVAPFPAVAAVVYLASSRGAAATAFVGALLFLVLSRRRWAALWALLIAGSGAIGYVLVLARFQELVNGPLGSAAAQEQGINAAFLLLAACAGTGLLYGLLAAVPTPRVPSAVGWAAAASIAAAAAIVIASLDLGRRFADFRRMPGEVALEGDDFARAHLLSAGGSGRWQFWEAAVDQFRASPLRGHGAGTYEAWWAQHGTLNTFVVDAHSLYLETLGELGLLGLILLLAAVGWPLAVGVHRLLQAPRGEGEACVALVSAAAAFLVAAAVDWMWELTVVGALGALVLGLLCGPAAAAAPEAGEDERPPRFGLGVASVAAAWIAGAVAVAPLLGDVNVRASQEATVRGELAEAVRRAQAARAIQPWSAAPRLQLALVYERAGRVERARDLIAEAIDRDPENWRLWLIAARLETKAGAPAEARRSLAEARRLNPRSPLFRA